MQLENKSEKQFSLGISVVSPSSSIKLIILPLAAILPFILNVTILNSSILPCPLRLSPSGLFPLRQILSPAFSIVISVFFISRFQVSPPSME